MVRVLSLELTTLYEQYFTSQVIHASFEGSTLAISLIDKALITFSLDEDSKLNEISRYTLDS